jgi:hypothetical protein
MSLWVNDMNAKELLLKEVDNIPEFILEEVWDFLQFLKVKYDKNKLESSLLSESALQKDWLKSEEDEAWQICKR